jgi:hypothetical protein
MSTPITSVSGCSSAGWDELKCLRRKVNSTKVDRPYSCATASVKSTVHMFDGRIVELLVHGEPDNMVLEV